MFKKILYFVTAVLLIILGIFLLRGDFVPFLQWWVVALGLGLIFIPLSSLLFSNFLDRGYLFSKAIGIAVTGYIMWIVSSLHILKFTAVSCIISVAIALIFNIVIFLLIRKYKPEHFRNLNGEPTINIFKTESLDFIITEELLFFGLFLIFLYIRGFKPEAYGTEKFMDYGFMTSMMRSEYMPPQDFWFSGTKLNYYYVGQFFATFLTKLTFVKVADAYNLMLMMLGAFTFSLPYSLGLNLTAKYMEERNSKRRLVPILSGITAGAAVCLAGNMHYPTFKWFEPAVRKFFGMEKSGYRYWFPDATRFIGYHPDTHDKTIHEFPSYSFVLGDLHAHVINILFVITVLGILYAWMLSRKAAIENKPPVWKEVINPVTIMLAFFIGLFHTTNFWDFPIYYVVCGAVILFSNMVVYNFKGKAVWITALQGIFIMLAGMIFCLPFTLNFKQISTTPLLAVAHTPLNQLIILWGLPIFMVSAFICFLSADFIRKAKQQPKTQSEKNKSKIFRFMEDLSSSDLFILTIGLCAIGLVLLPELIYIEDIYNGDYKRANTMFKLTYQAFIMFGICFGYIFPRLLRFGRTKRQIKTAAVGLILFLLSLCYVGNAVHSWFGNIFNPKGYKGIDAAAFMKGSMPDDYLATNWLNDNVTGIPVVLEANGDSYTDYERVSVITGLPTLLGWHTHEWLWKSDTTILDERAKDIETIYTSGDETAVRSLIEKYKVAYIYVGKLEQEKYPGLNNDLLRSLGEVVYDNSASADKIYETYIVKIK